MFTLASEEVYQDGKVIFKEGSSGTWVYYVVSGAVEISRTIGGKKHVFEILREGEIFGEFGFLGGIKRTGTARAMGTTTVGLIDREVLDNEYNKLSKEFRAILVSMVKRFEKTLNRASGFTSRKKQRAAKHLALEFKTPRSFIQAYAKNLGTGGIFIRTRHPLQEGNRFLLDLKLPGISHTFKIKCEVVWTRKSNEDAHGRPAGMGTKFYEMTQRDKKLLEGYIKHLTKSGLAG